MRLSYYAIQDGSHFLVRAGAKARPVKEANGQYFPVVLRGITFESKDETILIKAVKQSFPTVSLLCYRDWFKSCLGYVDNT